MKEFVILVDDHDRETGTAEKMEAHEKGWLHRALSVFIFNSRNELLLQKRSLEKYHSPGLWTNTCCSHPRPGEGIKEAAHRRLKEEMGLQAELHDAFTFKYLARFDNGLTEHELDHVFIGFSDETPVLNYDEVAEWKYLSEKKLNQDILMHPQQYTEWIKLCLTRVFEELKK